MVQTLNCVADDQEKVYRLLVCWRSQQNQPRSELIKNLIDSIDPKRKDVLKFLKEMGGNHGNKETRFQKFKKSVKR